jgi:hypothetical protein
MASRRVRVDRATRCLAGVAVAFALGLGVVVSGCGLGPDAEPQAISRSSLPNVLFETETGTTEVNGPDANIYLVSTQGDQIRLVRVPVSVGETNDRTRASIETLMAYMPTANSGGEALTSPVSGTPLLDLSADGSTLNVNMGSPAVEGTALRQALAQIVFTATDPTQSRFTSVRFLQDGRMFHVPLVDRTLEPGTPVRRDDFPQLDPARAPGTSTSSVVKR